MNPLIRVVLFAPPRTIIIAQGCPDTRVTLSCMMVLSTAVPATASVVVCPIKVIPLVITSVLVQLAVPAGTITVSPSEARATAVLTSTKDGVRAVMVAPAASAWPGTIKNVLATSAAHA